MTSLESFLLYHHSFQAESKLNMSFLDKVVEEYTARGANGVPGVVLSVIDKQGSDALTFPTTNTHLQ